ncbi:ATPase [Tianweitania sp. BSSL-BM11]|uniref:ATPase n=1 Tax=Tianweitania aestuarii TaxID=2814886 RepID=A0ABS5RTK7_9HYPH|nr:ATP12 family protein [Tianweitania aestuarii]MBS9720378.1 ATPase [Tianweitania aestuarii]
MRDILNDLEGGPVHKDEDPVKRAQRLTKPVMPKRFYKDVAVVQNAVGWVVELDGKAIRTPGQRVIALPSEAAAALVADEFRAQEDVVNLATMPAYRLVNTAVDGVASDPQAVIEDIMRFASSDLVFYRADSPEKLVALQAEGWDPVLDWARTTLGARFFLAEGVMHVEQPKESVAAVGFHLKRDADPFRLASLHIMTSIAGSALIALALEAGELSFDGAWNAAHVDEDWNIAQWGEDEEAQARRAFRRRDMQAAHALLQTRAVDGQ